MVNLTDWVERRKITFGLSVFFILWYVLQLVIFNWMGESFAHWLFYFEKPPNHVSPGNVLAPISHDFSTLTHIGGNLPLLFVAGGFIEPYIGGKKLAAIVIGASTFSIWFANGVAIFVELWILAGASGGVLALWAYAGLKKQKLARKYQDGPEGLTSKGIETVAAVLLLVAIPIFPLYETFVLGSFHSGHTIGILLGVALYFAESTNVAEVFSDSESV